MEGHKIVTKSANRWVFQDNFVHSKCLNVNFASIAQLGSNSNLTYVACFCTYKLQFQTQQQGRFQHFNNQKDAEIWLRSFGIEHWHLHFRKFTK